MTKAALNQEKQKGNQANSVMSIDKARTFPKFLQGLSARLAAAAAANAELLLPSGAGEEMKKLSESTLQIANKTKDMKSNPQAWVRELEDIAYEIDAILQWFSPKAGVAQSSSNDPSRGGANPIRTAKELRAIRTRLDKILKKQNLNSIQPGADQETITKMSIRNCPLEPLPLMGKDGEDREKIISLLFSAKDSGILQAGPCIIAIDGKGKATTELARSIFDDKRVLNRFAKRVWVSASEIVDPDKLSRLVSKPASTVFWLHKTLDGNSEEQQVLVVLDDVRNKRSVELRGSWIRDDSGQRLHWINDGTETKGKLVISTDKELYNFPSYPPNSTGRNVPQSQKVKRPSAEESWVMFKERVFARGRRPELEAIGRKIVSNIEGSQAMIDKIGTILSANLEVRFWEMMLQSQVWKLPVDKELSQPALAEFCYHSDVPKWHHSIAPYSVKPRR